MDGDLVPDDLPVDQRVEPQAQVIVDKDADHPQRRPAQRERVLRSRRLLVDGPEAGQRVDLSRPAPRRPTAARSARRRRGRAAGNVPAPRRRSRADGPPPRHSSGPWCPEARETRTPSRNGGRPWRCARPCAPVRRSAPISGAISADRSAIRSTRSATEPRRRSKVTDFRASVQSPIPALATRRSLSQKNFRIRQAGGENLLISRQNRPRRDPLFRDWQQ